MGETHSESIDTLVQPEGHHIPDKFTDLRVLPVQIGLLCKVSPSGKGVEEEAWE